MLSVQLAILGSYRLETILEANDSESLERKKYHWLKRSNEKYWNILICKGVTALLVKKKEKRIYSQTIVGDVSCIFQFTRTNETTWIVKGTKTSNWFPAVTSSFFSSLTHNSPWKVKSEIWIKINDHFFPGNRANGGTRHKTISRSQTTARPL